MIKTFNALFIVTISLFCLTGYFTTLLDEYHTENRLLQEKYMQNIPRPQAGPLDRCVDVRLH